MSLEEIEIHFEEMKRISEHLSELAGGLQKLINKSEVEAIGGVKEAWSSENTDIFIDKGIRRMEKLRKAAEDLQVLSEDIMERAMQIYEVEKWNTLTAITRNYS